ncbi:MAG: PASTA domain-containing protein, partial [Mycobacterium sp.]|nr:PASTA domain-containing protein [Mycobacterium sp.]
ADSAGFKINVQHIQSTKPRGEVIGTTPPAGTMADKGSTVTLQVSDSDRILMPNLAGSDPGDVLNKLRAAGWQGGLASVRQITQITMDPNLVGKVVAQQPTAGSPITTSNPISISVGVAPMGAG